MTGGCDLSLHMASLRFFTCQVGFKCKCSKTKAKVQALTKFLLACHTCQCPIGPVQVITEENYTEVCAQGEMAT